jgi:predicted transcriptional regulator of viral defense system/very-short-patch-repair endonuclease
LDERIAQVAEMQHGAITVAQLRRCGLGDSGVRRRAARGLLHRLHRGVYVPGHRRLPPLGRVAAAVLASGPDAVASHLTGARLYGTRSDSQTLVDVTVGSRTGRRHTGVISHSAATIRPQDITVVDGIPVTSIARTLLDCAPILGRRGTEKMVADAERLQLFNLVAVEEILAHVPGHAGAAILRAAVADAAGARGHTASCAEDALLVAFRAAGLPEPECNAAIQLDDGSFVFADFLWREACLVAEADPRGTHDRTASYRSDRRRDRALDRVGLETMRFSDEDLRDPAACAAEVAERHNFRAGAARKL